MPWTPRQAKSKTKKAKTPKLQRMWRDVANSALKRTGNEATAIKMANGVVKRRGRRKK